MMGPRPQCYIPSTRSVALWFWRRRFLKGYIHLGHVTQTQRTNFRSPIPLRLHMKFGFDWPSGFGEEDLWKWWTDNGRTDDGSWLYYKLTNEPKDSGELKCHFSRSKCYEQFQLYPPCGFYGDGFFIYIFNFFFTYLAFRLTWQSIKFRGLDKSICLVKDYSRNISVKKCKSFHSCPWHTFW